MPSFEELGINLDGLLSKYNNSNSNNSVNGFGDGVENGKAGMAPDVEFQSSKLKNSAYKKLKEKVSLI